jgi:hypothetical protein
VRDKDVGRPIPGDDGPGRDARAHAAPDSDRDACGNPVVSIDL